jgi:hypothetical protein
MDRGRLVLCWWIGSSVGCVGVWGGCIREGKVGGWYGARGALLYREAQGWVKGLRDLGARGRIICRPAGSVGLMRELSGW